MSELDDLMNDNSSIGEEETGPNVHMLLKIVILGVIGFVSVFGNLIVLGALIVCNVLYKSLRISIYIVIGGLALADIIVAVMNVPEEIIYYADKGEFKSEAWCKAYGFLSNSCQYIAAFHLVVLGVLRGILLTDRAHHGPTVIHAIITSAVLWIVSLSANIPMISSSILEPVLLKCVVVPGNPKKSEDGLQTEDSDADEIYLLLSAAFSYFFPLILIVVIYLFTGYMSKRYFEDSYSRRERRMSKMISSLIVTFALCRLPSEMVTLLWFYQVKNTDVMAALNQDTQKYLVWIHVREYLSILSMLDMALRPIIYATMSREFGTIFDKVINCTGCKEPEEEESTQRLQRRGEEIQEVLRTPLNRPGTSRYIDADDSL